MGGIVICQRQSRQTSVVRSRQEAHPNRRLIMNKVFTLVALLGLTVNSVALAADTKTNVDSFSSSTAASTESTASSKPAHKAHEHIEGMKAVTSLSSLTDKQKKQINTIYENNKSQYDSLQKQVRTLRETEWSQVKPLLTPEQLTELQNSRPKHHRGRGKAPAATPVAAPAADAHDAPDAPANK
jgi:hypothetical protein